VSWLSNLGSKGYRMRISRRLLISLFGAAVGAPCTSDSVRAQGTRQRIPRPTQPRIQLVATEKLDAPQEAVTETATPQRQLHNIDRVMLNAPAAAKAFLVWAGYVLSSRNDLEPRHREIVILRTGYLCRAQYEWAQHIRIGRREGLTAEDIGRIKTGASAAGWSEAEVALIRACDELHADQCVSDVTWAALRRRFTQKQCMDVVFTAGQYTQVSMILNSFGVPLEAGQVIDPDLK
jgi:4-carboxymuconolactone decarboxylase